MYILKIAVGRRELSSKPLEIARTWQISPRQTFVQTTDYPCVRRKIWRGPMSQPAYGHFVLSNLATPVAKPFRGSMSPSPFFVKCPSVLNNCNYFISSLGFVPKTRSASPRNQNICHRRRSGIFGYLPMVLFVLDKNKIVATKSYILRGN